MFVLFIFTCQTKMITGNSYVSNTLFNSHSKTSEAHSELCQTLKIDLFVKLVNVFQPLNNFTKTYISRGLTGFGSKALCKYRWKLLLKLSKFWRRENSKKRFRIWKVLKRFLYLGSFIYYVRIIFRKTHICDVRVRIRGYEMWVFWKFCVRTKQIVPLCYLKPYVGKLNKTGKFKSHQTFLS